MEIKRASNEFTDRDNIFDGARTFTGATLNPSGKEGAIQDISTLLGRVKQTDEPSTEFEQFTLCSSHGELMRIAKIARPGALYGAAVSAQTFETIDDTIVNPIDCE